MAATIIDIYGNDRISPVDPFIPPIPIDGDTYYTVNVSSSSGGIVRIKRENGTLTTSIKDCSYGEIIYVNCTPSLGYTFNRWTATGANDTSNVYSVSNGYFTVGNSNVTVSASFTAKKYTLSAPVITNSVGTVIGTISLSSYSASTGSNVYVTCTPKEGYIFNSWSATGTTLTTNTNSASGGYVTVQSSNITVSALFSPIWFSQDEYWTFSGNNISLGSKYLTYKTITISSGKMGVITLRSSTGDYDGIFLSTYIPQNFDGSFTLDNIKKTNTLYNNSSFVSGCISYTNTIDIPKEITITNVPSGTYYVGARWGGGTPLYGNYVQYKVTENEINTTTWIQDGNYRICNGRTQSSPCLIYEPIRTSGGVIGIPEGYTGKIEFIANTREDYDGIFLTKKNVIPSSWSGDFVNQPQFYGCSEYIIFEINDNCISCGACENECPKGAISEGQPYIIDPEVCVGCGNCLNKCNVDAIEEVYKNNIQSYITGKGTLEITNIPPGIYYVAYRRNFTIIPHIPKCSNTIGKYYKIQVIDEESNPIIGATVTIPGTNTVTTTDIDGYAKLQLSLNNTSTLINVSCSGYESVEGLCVYGSSSSSEVTSIITLYENYSNIVKYKLTNIGGTYSLTFKPNGGKLIGDKWGSNKETSNDTTITVTSGLSNCSKMGYCEKDGCIFNGWYSSSTNGFQVYDKLGNAVECDYWGIEGNNKIWKYSNSTSVYAQYTPYRYTISYNSNCSDNMGGSMSSDVCDYGKQYKLKKNVFERQGYTFKGWGETSTSTEIKYQDEVTISNLSSKNGDVITLYAIWEAKPSYDDSRDLGLMNDYNSMSVNRIKSNIENPQTVSYNMKDGESRFKMRILDPDSIETLDIFTSSPIMETEKNIISTVDVKIKSDTNNLNLKIINRYSGYYNPIFKDILFYNDYDGKPFSNTSFDEDYEDNYGKFGVIKNMWFHKVNDEKTGIIGTNEACYPLTGEYALDFRDYNIFSTSWDKDYFTKQEDINHSESCTSIGSMKEKLCMFGSKYLNVPEIISIECFNDGKDWNDDYITNPIGCSGEVMYKEVNDNSVDFYFFLHKRLIRYFHNILKAEFEKYINKEYSYGKKDSLDDDIEEYIEKNILKLYELKKISVYVKRIKTSMNNSQIENCYGEYLDKTVNELKKDGFVETGQVSLSKINTDDFDRKLTYNLRNCEQESFGFSILIKKI